ILVGHARLPKRDVFRYGIVLAISDLCRERRKWTAPGILRSGSGKTTAWSNGEIDRSVHLADAGATLQRASPVDDRQQERGCSRSAIEAIGSAAVQKLFIPLDVLLDGMPFGPQRTISELLLKRRKRLECERRGRLLLAILLGGAWRERGHSDPGGVVNCRLEVDLGCRRRQAGRHLARVP